MASFVDRVYMNSPVWAQQVMVAVWGLWWYRRRYGPEFYRLVEEFKSHDNWTVDQYRDYQEQQLQKVIQAAWQSRYYREVFTQAGLAPDLPPFEALKRIPSLSKETLRTRAEDLLTQSPLPKGTVSFKSSGTTGTPTVIYYTPEFHALETAVQAMLSLRWAGVSHRERRVMLGVRKVCRFTQTEPPFWRFSPIEDMAYASIYHLSAQYLPHYLKFLRSYQPAIIMGYPSALLPIARYALEHNDFPAPAKVIITSSETLTLPVREALEAVWKCKVYDRYGAVEACVFASQCEYGNYHVAPEIGIVEVVDSADQPCPPGKLGEVICTGLRNTLQPLIRYQIGDVARWAISQNCSCGRVTPILEGIEGRFEDICYTPDGREMLRFDTVFKGIETIREAQVVQEKLDQFIIKIIPTSDFHQHDEELIQANMRLHVGANVKVIVERVEQIPRSASGKFRAVVCKLTQEEKRSLHSTARV